MNEYHEKFLEAHAEAQEVRTKGDKVLWGQFARDLHRYELVHKYAWGVPNDEALAAIADLNTPVVELGAGTGYWSYLLEAAGVEVLPLDLESLSRGANARSKANAEAKASRT